MSENSVIIALIGLNVLTLLLLLVAQGKLAQSYPAESKELFATFTSVAVDLSKTALAWAKEASAKTPSPLDDAVVAVAEKVISEKV